MKNKVARTAALVALALGLGTAQAATVFEKGDAKLDLAFEAGAGFFYVDKANLGGGQDFDPATAEDPTLAEWNEYYIKPKLMGSYKLGSSLVFGEWSVVASKTGGEDGDAIGATAPGDTNLDTENAFVGWKSGAVIPGLPENGFEITLGKAPIRIADGFVMSDGAGDGDSNAGGDRPAFWFGPHSAFERAAHIKVNTAYASGDAFWFETDKTQAVTQGAGVNLEAPIGKYGTVGAMFIKLLDSETDSRHHMSVIEGRYMGNPLADLVKTAYLNLEYVNQTNTDSDVEVKAYAYAAEAGYTFPSCPAKTTVAYRYTVYSGDDPSTEKSEAYDSLFQEGFARGWGTWLEGEIVGEYIYGNSNKKSHTVMVKTQPFETLAAGVLGYRFYADKGDVYGADLSGKHLADEVNVYLDWSATENLVVSAAVGRAWPGESLKDLGFGKATDLFEISGVFKF